VEIDLRTTLANSRSKNMTSEDKPIWDQSRVVTVRSETDAGEWTDMTSGATGTETTGTDSTISAVRSRQSAPLTTTVGRISEDIEEDVRR